MMKINTSIKTGLNDKEVIESRKKYGSNKVLIKKKNSFFNLILESLSDPIIKILLIALGIKILFLFKDSNIYETLGIAVAVFLASFISAISEYGSEKALEKLSKENDNLKVKVLRNSKKTIINSDEVVVGDIIYLESGDKVVADGYILSGSVSIDESVLTGESNEKEKSINDIVYSGSIVTDKNAIILVTSVGKNTYYGKIAENIQEKSSPSPLKQRLSDLAKNISRFGYIGAFLVFLSYMINAVFIPNNFDLSIIFDIKLLVPHIIYALTLSVAVVVMAVPEGLPMMITLVLSSNMKRLLNRKVLVRKLVGIETSGSLNILFTDKTGTLTEGKLKVNSFITPELIEYSKYSEINTNNEIIYQSIVYNNDAFFSDNECIGGNTTDRAILSFVGSDSKTKYKILNKESFNSKLKYSSITTNYDNSTTFYKGAYEIILDKCNKYLTSNGIERVLIEKERLRKYIDNKMSSGMRVLSLSYSKNNKDFVLVGFICLKDNIRKEAFEGINLIKKSGIQICMLTGDHKNTALSIARELKIIDSNDDIVLTSEEFNNMSDNEVKKILPRLKVLSRCLPNDKNRLVSIALEENLVVGMTGDGVNDAPALKKASVGFSMGSGTEIAKYSSDIVILDDNIKSISNAILYGRTIFKSIRKFVIFQLSVNLCAVLLSVIGPFIGVLSPITVIQVLWVNMVMDTFAGLAFSFERADIRYMEELPKKKEEQIINKYMINQIVCDGIYSLIMCIWFLKSPLILSIYENEKYLMTAFFGLFIFIDIFNAFNSRTQRINTFKDIFNNKIFLLIFLFITTVQIILIYYGGELFRTTGLSLYEFEVMILVAFSIIPFDIIRKIIINKKGLDRSV